MNRLNLPQLLREPEVLRGLDRLIERARWILDRNMRMPVRKAEPKPLARTA